MGADIKTYIIEAKYSEADDAGGYVWIGRAYNDRQAYRMCAMQMILDNEWEAGDCARQYTSLIDAYHEELTVLWERGGRLGTCCPNCTSEDVSKIVVAAVNDEEVYARSLSSKHEDLRCNSCGYHWIPLGFHHDIETPTEADIDKELDEFEALMAQDPDERDEDGGQDRESYSDDQDRECYTA